MAKLWLFRHIDCIKLWHSRDSFTEKNLKIKQNIKSTLRNYATTLYQHGFKNESFKTMTERWKLNKNFADEKNTPQLDQGDFNINKIFWTCFKLSNVG